MNLHGNANDEKFKKQFYFLRKISQLIVVIPENEKELANAEFSDNDPPVLVVHNFEELDFKFPANLPHDDFSFLEPTNSMVCNFQFQAVRSKINQSIRRHRKDRT